MRPQHVLEPQRLAVRPGQRHPPVRILVDGSRLILSAPVTDGIAQRRAEQARGCPGQEPMQGVDGLIDVGVLLQQTTPAQLVQPSTPTGLVGSEFFVQRAGEQAE